MTQPTPPADLLDSLMRALEPTFRLDDLVALSPERALYRAWDRLLKRSVALRVHLVPGAPGRAWFLRESETLAALDHAAIRHVYAAWTAGDFAYRTANWIEGESLADAMRRGQRPIPTAHAMVRDLLGGLEHAHARGVIMRRIVPTTLMIEISGRPVITDLRYANWCLAEVPPEERGACGARWATTTSCWTRSARVASGACSGRATWRWSARSLSRCCIPRSPPTWAWWSASGARPSSPPSCATPTS